ncbi:MAG TPA: GAF domain-containing protein [Blastocatellia bacterium]|nr:GAF domain-containing protein [Blastocatellia bacterium]
MSVNREKSLGVVAPVETEAESDRVHAVIQAALHALEVGDLRAACSVVLEHAVKITESEYGFFSVTMEGPFERLLSTKGFRWHETINRKFYDDAMQSFEGLGYLDFHNMANLAGRAMTHNETVLSNSPADDPRAAGIPPGHPPLNCFLGTPFRKDGAVVAVIGLANRPQGYGATQEAEVKLLDEAALAISEEYHRRRRAVSAAAL